MVGTVSLGYVKLLLHMNILSAYHAECSIAQQCCCVKEVYKLKAFSRMVKPLTIK